tara:strand:+ start:889 stop:1056 length:168 start_codon:yes stop_codon:yes gene_type:complete
MKVYEVRFFGSNQSFSQGVFITLARAQEERIFSLKERIQTRMKAGQVESLAYPYY